MCQNARIPIQNFLISQLESYQLVFFLIRNINLSCDHKKRKIRLNRKNIQKMYPLSQKYESKSKRNERYRFSQNLIIGPTNKVTLETRIFKLILYNKQLL